MKSLFCLLVTMIVASPAFSSSREWKQRYDYNLVYHYENIYRKYFGTTQWVRGNDHKFKISSNTPHSDKKVYDWIKELKNIRIYSRKGKLSQYTYVALKKRLNPLYYEDNAHFYLIPRISFEDDPSDANIVLYNNGTYYYTNSAHSIGQAAQYPPRWRPWTKPIDLERKWTPYCGMIDDDLLYDWRKENPFNTILTHNKKSPFLYVYNFKMYRDRIQDWAFHDRLVHGWKSHGKDEDKNPARLTYGPILDNANHEIVRAVRIYTFLRLYLAKLRLAKLLHPAPPWIEANGDYSTRYPVHRPYWVISHAKRIDPERAGRSFLPDSAFIKRIIQAPNDDYWKLLGSKIVIPTESLDALREKNWRNAKLWGSIAHHFELFKDLYLYKMFVRSPLQKQNDFHLYANTRYLSVALWDGQNGYGRFRHEFRGGLKYFYPFFERADKVGNTHVSGLYYKSRWKNAPSNTTGIIYAGHMTPKEFQAYCAATGKKPLQVWKDALRGPFMIVSDRTYKRYGHAYFEKLAGHRLKSVDATGALIASAARVQLALDPDQLKQLIGMDYFYYKKNKKEVRGSHSMRAASSIKIHKNKIQMTGTYKPARIIRNPVPPEIKALRGKDRSSVYFKNIDAFTYIIRDIHVGLARDEKLFPGMSIREVNYLPYHTGEIVQYPRKERIYHVICSDSPKRGGTVILNDIRKLITRRKVPGIRWVRRNKTQFIKRYLAKPRTPRNIEFLSVVDTMKQSKVVEKLHQRFGYGASFRYQLQLVLAKRIPWMAYNPYIFLAYYKHINKLMPVHRLVVSNNANGKEMGNGISDGVMVWYGDMNLGGAQQAPVYTAKKYAKHNKTLSLLWCYSLYKQWHKGIHVSLLNGGKLRKWYARGIFPWWETTVGRVEGSPFSSWNYHHTYKWLQNRKGNPVLLRDPAWALGQGFVNHSNRIELFMNLFPGMIRYLYRGMAGLPVKEYAHIPFSKSYSEFSYQPDVRTMLHGGEYIGITKAYLSYYQGDYSNNYDSRKHQYYKTMQNLNALLAILPVDNHAFVISDGIHTSIMKYKKSVTYNKNNSTLYRGLKPL